MTDSPRWRVSPASPGTRSPAARISPAMASAHCSAAGGFLEYEYDEESVYDIRPGGASDTAELAGVRRAFETAPLDAVPEPARSAVDIGVPAVAGAGYTLALLPDVAASAGGHGVCAECGPRGSDGDERFVDAEATGGETAAGPEWAGGAVSLSSAAAGLSIGELKLLVASKLLQLSLAVRSSPYCSHHTARRAMPGATSTVRV